MLRSVKLISVSNQEEFSDLVGQIGTLRLDPQSKDRAVNWFAADNGESVELTRKRVAEKDGIVRVSTTLGNVFKFRLTPGKPR